MTTEAAKPAAKETPEMTGLGGCVRSDSVIGGTEGVGFEPTGKRSLPTVFKTVPINHSGTPPVGYEAGGGGGHGDC